MKGVFHRHRKEVIGVALAAALALGLAAPTLVAAVQTFSGYAWSGNIGWIALGLKGSSPGIAINADNTVTGYAWSPSIGWIQFGGLSGFPAGSGTLSANAKLVGGTAIKGWARACLGTIKSGDSTTKPAFPGDCSTMTSRPDWDGWISLFGTTYGVTLNSGTLSGYAWAGDPVGWVSFSGASVSCQATTPTCSNSTHISYTDAQCTLHDIDCVALNGAGSICMTVAGQDQCVTTSGCLSVNSDVRVAGNSCVSNAKVHSDTPTTLYWKIDNAQNCSLTRNGAAWLSGLTASGQRAAGNLSVPTTYVLTCDSTLDGAGVYTAAAVINIVPEYEEI